jgi:hypothetical protein
MFEVPNKMVERVVKKARLVPVAAEDAFFDHEERPEAPTPWAQLVAPDTSQFERTRALFAILRDAIPDQVFKTLTGQRYEYQTEVLPLDAGHFQFESKKVGSGGECMVYKLTALDPGVPSYVIKIDQRNGTKRVDELVDRGKQVKAEYELECEWYRDLPGLIPEELQFIAKSPRRGGNALFTIQKYFGTADEIHDLFRGYPKDELIRILRSDPDLCNRFKRFATITLERAEREGLVPDTLGDRNIVLVDCPTARRQIHILDPHAIKDLHQLKDSVEMGRIQADLGWLHEMSAVLAGSPIETA